jgi:hypothetical protein
MLNLTISVFILSLLFYIFIGFYHSDKVKSYKDFFHIGNHENDYKGITTVLAGNLTLGTGLLYILDLSNRNLFGALLVPVGIVLGYAALYLLSQVSHLVY